MATTKEKQELLDNIKHGFNKDDAVVRITPLHKKSITQMVQLYDIPNDPNQKFVEINETYRWGYGYKEGDDMNYEHNWKGDTIWCDSTIGHGAELDDLCSVFFDYEGPWTDEEKEEFEDRWYNGDPEDNDGRSGMGWLYDYQDKWQIEDEQLIINGPFKFDVMDAKEYNKIYIEDWKPVFETEEGNNGN